MHPKVIDFLNKAPKWQQEMEQLRSFLLDCGLTEEFKWRAPCYTFQKSNKKDYSDSKLPVSVNKRLIPAPSDSKVTT